LEVLSQTHDIVIVDTPPLLPVSDALVVSEYVDAAVIVCGLGIARKPTLRRVQRIAATLPTRVLGVIVTGSSVEAASYGRAYGPVERISVGPIGSQARTPDGR
jgi:Mrp family chromosome partitioning ATPase